MKVVKIDQVRAEPGAGTLFTGPVTCQPLITGDMSKQFIVSQVNFSKGVRNKFHIHTSDQILIVTAGKGICATEKEEVTGRPGGCNPVPGGGESPARSNQGLRFFPHLRGRREQQDDPG